MKGKRVLVVGGGPTAALFPSKEYAAYGVIARINNYQKVNSDRTDIFFSYFGKCIKKTKKELEADGVQWLVCKYPNADMSDALALYDVEDSDFRWVYALRRKWWFGDTISLSCAQLLSYIKLVDGHMPTTGLCAALFLRPFCASLDIVGFDCFQSGVHDLNKPWDKSGGHRPDMERNVLIKLHQLKRIRWVEYENELEVCH
jgi:hypothetical protein